MDVEKFDASDRKKNSNLNIVNIGSALRGSLKKSVIDVKSLAGY